MLPGDRGAGRRTCGCRSTPPRPRWPAPRSPPAPRWSTTSPPRCTTSRPSGGVGWVAMHMQGEPRTMQARPRATTTWSPRSTAFLVGRADAAAADAGVAEVWIDPGHRLRQDRRPQLGAARRARRSWCATGLARSRSAPAARRSSARRWPPPTGPAAASPPDDRLEGSVATAVRAAAAGAGMVRVHDVAATVAALDAAGPADRSTASVGHEQRESSRWL